MNRAAIEEAIIAMETVPPGNRETDAFLPRNTRNPHSYTARLTPTSDYGQSGIISSQSNLGQSGIMTSQSNLQPIGVTKKKGSAFCDKFAELLRDHRGDSSEEHVIKCPFVDERSVPKLKQWLNAIFISTGLCLLLGVLLVILVTAFVNSDANKAAKAKARLREAEEERRQASAQNNGSLHDCHNCRVYKNYHNISILSNNKDPIQNGSNDSHHKIDKDILKVLNTFDYDNVQDSNRTPYMSSLTLAGTDPVYSPDGENKIVRRIVITNKLRPDKGSRRRNGKDRRRQKQYGRHAMTNNNGQGQDSDPDKN